MRTRARVAHAIPGRLRLRFEDDARLDDGNDLSRRLGLLRTVSGVLGADLKLAARSAVVRYDPASIDEATVLAELKQHGIDILAEEIRPSPQPSPKGSGGTAPSGQAATQDDKKAGDRSAVMEALIGPPPKLDRRFVESLALSGVSLLAARRIGLALGGWRRPSRPTSWSGLRCVA